MKKNTLKPIMFVLILLTFMSSMTSCKNSITKEETNASIISFFKAIEIEDYEAAASLFHTSQPTKAELLMEYFNSIEEEQNIDFSSGITIERYTKTKSAAYDIIRGGAYYEVDMILFVGEKETGTSLEVTLEFIKNDDGFGMYNIHI
ncbi:MAG: hypothetical protein IJ333_05455 [Clostridia bacterium]|nr:hypothetical protein [Clostridia bacterium]